MQLCAHTNWASCIEQNLLRAQQNEATEEPFIGLIEDKRQARAFLQWSVGPTRSGIPDLVRKRSGIGHKVRIRSIRRDLVLCWVVHIVIESEI